MLPTTVCVILIYFTSMFESDAPTRNVASQAYAIVFITVANFMSIDYLPHLIARDTIFIFLGCITAYERNRHEENTIAAAGVIIVLFLVGGESIIYVNHKAKANLFMRIQAITLQ